MITYTFTYFLITLAGFYAKPMKKADNSTDMMRWETGIPGKEDTDWANGVYKVMMEFPEEYPSKPPKCKFDPPLFHPNVFPSGAICLSILKEDDGWRPAITIKQMLLAVQDLLVNPNPNSPAQEAAYNMFVRQPEQYRRKIREQALKNVPTN